MDYVFSTNTFEHVQHLPEAFAELYRVLRPGGQLIASWAPLFYSPQGYRLYWACQVPYAHLLCGLEAIVTLRNARTRGSRSSATTWEQLGLNGKRFADYRSAALKAGFTLNRFDRVPVRGFSRLATLPVVGDLMTFGIECAIQKPGTA